jgi:hypothetical protein
MVTLSRGMGMFKIKSAALAVVAATALSSCNVASVMKSNPERDADTDALIADIGAGRSDAIVGKMASGNSPQQIRAQLPFLKTLVPAGAVPQGKTVGWQTFAGTGGTTYSLNRAYEYPDRTLGVSATYRKQSEAWKVLNFNINVQLKPGATQPAQAGEAPVIVVRPEPAPQA